MTSDFFQKRKENMSIRRDFKVIGSYAIYLRDNQYHVGEISSVHKTYAYIKDLTSKSMVRIKWIYVYPALAPSVLRNELTYLCKTKTFSKGYIAFDQDSNSFKAFDTNQKWTASQFITYKNIKLPSIISKLSFVNYNIYEIIKKGAGNKIFKLDQIQQAPAHNVNVHLSIKCQSGIEIYFKARKTAKLKTIMDRYCDEVGKDAEAITFSFNGKEISPDATINQLGMANFETILVNNKDAATLPEDKKGDGFPSDHSNALTIAEQAKLVFPPTKIMNDMRSAGYAKKVSGFAAVYLAAVLEYMVAEMVELAGNACLASKQSHIKDRHIYTAVDKDEELKELVGSTFSTFNHRKPDYQTVSCNFYRYKQTETNAYYHIQDAIILFIESKFGVAFQDIVPLISSPERKLKMKTFTNVACGVRLFTDIIGIPSILKYVGLKEKPFETCLQIISLSEYFFAANDKCQKICNMLFHHCNKLKYLKWILRINNGSLFEKYVINPFISMSECQDIESFQNKYIYFHIYVSLLVFKHKKRLDVLREWITIYSSQPQIVGKYYQYVLATFSEKKNDIKEICQQMKSKCRVDSAQYREKIYCGNRICNINFYLHKYSLNGLIGKWYKCKRCKIVYYCSRKCQKIDWNKHHKEICDTFVIS